MFKSIAALSLISLLAGCGVQSQPQTYTMPKGGMGSAEHQMVQPNPTAKPQEKQVPDHSGHMPKGGMASVPHEMQ